MKLICRKGSGYNEIRHFLAHEMDTKERWDLAAVFEKIAFQLTRKGTCPLRVFFGLSILLLYSA